MTKAKRPYEDLSDKDVVTTWRKRDAEYTDFYMIPRLEGQQADFGRSQAHCAKLDRLEDELIHRGLFNQKRTQTQAFYDIERQ